MTIGYEYQKQHRIKYRARAVDYLGGKCSQCESVTNLDFDHLNPADKVLEISVAIVAGWSWQNLLLELDKCQLLCKEHHIQKSQSDGSFGGIPWNKTLIVKHGTAVMYLKPYCCRCNICRAWRYLYREKLVDSKGSSLTGDLIDFESIALRRPNEAMKHGTYRNYRVQKCRCSECRRANTDRMKQYRLEKSKR